MGIRERCLGCEGAQLHPAAAGVDQANRSLLGQQYSLTMSPAQQIVPSSAASMVHRRNAPGPAQPRALGPDGLAARRERRDQRNDTWFRYVVTGCALFVLIALLGAAVSMLWGGREAFGTFGWSFLWSSDWDAVQKKFGALVPIYGTLVTALIAMLIAVPVSLGIAIFLTEIAPTWMRTPVSTAIELLAGIPSIIYGMWGLFVFVPFMGDKIDPWLDEHVGPLPIIGPLFQGPPIGFGMLTAGIALPAVAVLLL